MLFLVSLIALVLGMNVAGWQPGTPLSRTVGMCMVISGLATFIPGIVALIKFKDRSFVVILAAILGSFAILVTIMEVVEAITYRLTH